MYDNGDELTIEGGEGQAVPSRFWGKTATVIKAVGCFVIVQCDGHVFGCLQMFTQRKVTAASLAARFGG